jgi:hypothetical protein
VHLDKLGETLFRNFKESLESHVLYARMLLMHEFEILVDDSFQETPMLLQKSGVLADDVHEI